MHSTISIFRKKLEMLGGVALSASEINNIRMAWKTNSNCYYKQIMLYYHVEYLYVVGMYFTDGMCFFISTLLFILMIAI